MDKGSLFISTATIVFSFATVYANNSHSSYINEQNISSVDKKIKLEQVTNLCRAMEQIYDNQSNNRQILKKIDFEYRVQKENGKIDTNTAQLRDEYFYKVNESSLKDVTYMTKTEYKMFDEKLEEKNKNTTDAVKKALNSSQIADGFLIDKIRTCNLNVFKYMDQIFFEK